MSTGKEEKVEIHAPELQGKYQLTEKIDHGGYATVFRAIDLQSTTSNHIVAIKRVQSANIKPLHTNHPCIEAKILEEFRSHPHFPTIREVLCDESSGSYSIVMDYFEHQPFCEYNHSLNEQETIKYIYVLLSCVDTLSQKGYIHRDIKPSNFLHNPATQRYLLIDFGLCQLQSSIECKYERERKLIQAHRDKNKPASQRSSKSKRNVSTNSNRKRTVRRNHVYSGNMHQKSSLKLQVIRDGTPGFRAPEIILASNHQDSRIDIFNVGLILSCIMFGTNAIFMPQNDDQQLVQFVSVYGWQKVYETANALDRSIELRGLSREAIYTKNGAKRLNSQNWVSGYEDVVQGNRAKFSYWIKQRIKCLNNEKGKENVMIIKRKEKKIRRKKVNNCQRPKCREWSEDLYDLLDRLTEFNPFQRITPREALQHKIFSCISQAT